MYCTGCGKELGEGDQYCSRCGRSTAPVQPMRRLVRPMNQKMIAGVCAGFARYFGIDTALMRLIWIVLFFVTGGIALLVYPIAWIVMPEADGTPTYKQVQDQFDKHVRRPEDDIAARIYTDEPAPAANGAAKTSSTDGNGKPAA